jgi:hypothetical protein
MTPRRYDNDRKPNALVYFSDSNLAGKEKRHIIKQMPVHEEDIHERREYTKACETKKEDREGR